MRKSNVMIAILSTAAMMLGAPAHAKPGDKEQKPPLTLDYHLPEAKIGFAVSHMITSCPGPDGKGFAMDTMTAIKPVYEGGEKIRINPKGNLFIDREVKLEFHENGTLKSFNGSSKGQGGKIVAAAINADEARLAESDYDATVAEATAKVTQISKHKVIRFDGSSIFGSRAVAATFDQKGELTSIGYTSTGGADALAGVVDASVAAGIEPRDQEANATKREVERRTQANALEALIDAEAKKEAEDAAAAVGG